MPFFDSDLESFIDSSVPKEPELLTNLRRYTSLNVVNGSRMQSNPTQGRILSIISKIVAPATVLEIGTLTGYSTLCLAEGLSKDGTIHTFEVNDEVALIAQSFFNQTQVAKNIVLHLDNVFQFLVDTSLTFDMVFIDGNKKEYVDYYRHIRPKVRSGSVIIIDNILWDGKIFYPTSEKDIQTKSIKDLNQIIAKDESVEAFPIIVRDGLFIIRVK